ncbi:tRNA pseudouridine(38-40) synthase TruA [Pararhizobium mangrovi]|uniref:tRNA pseudouridine synthase A n=1 Tax=Pararhizobium mangrovi TaxID=2590452 RepID=A0A506U7S0_9HYPH|nr:tRNA pseudouridine(38-40) synthase TruA [Pararhizobium mangrovi]TPW28659.1 tRNA pseudouridine(38-40) synthase TruA [Pararhizobium mangrovi]
MPRFRLTVEYDGTPYVGWQRQDNGASVQGALERAVAGFAGETVTIRGAGRTDAGVHARGQVAHLDLSKDWPADTVRDATNAHLKLAGERVAVVAAEAVCESFDARFSATRRHYLYRIVNRRAPVVLERDRAWQIARPLDVDAMHRAAQSLVGKHDFTTFRSVQCQANSPVRTLDRLSVTRVGEAVEIEAAARSFLHNQIRSFVGTLVEVGTGRWSADDVEAALAARERSACGPVAPPAGLYFMRVEYGEDRPEDAPQPGPLAASNGDESAFV